MKEKKRWKLVNKTPIIIGVLFLVLIIIVLMSPLRNTILQATIQGQFEDLGVSCQQVSECEDFAREQGASNEDIANLDMRCNNNQCQLKIIKIRPDKWIKTSF